MQVLVFAQGLTSYLYFALTIAGVNFAPNCPEPVYAYQEGPICLLIQSNSTAITLLIF